NVLVLTMDGILTVFVGGLFSYALGVVVVDEWKETKGHGSGVSQTGLGLMQQAPYQRKMNEREEQLLSVLSPTTPKSYVFERNERVKQRTQYRDRALLKFYFTLAFIALAITFILFIVLFFAGVVQLMMYSVAVSVVCFSLMYNANWGLIPACCCCCLREPVLTLQDFKKLDGSLLLLLLLLLYIHIYISFLIEQKQSPLEKKIRELSDRWVEYICVPLDTCHFRRACQNISLLCKSQPQSDTTTTTTTASTAATVAAATTTTTTSTTTVALVTDDDQNKEKEGSLNSEKELQLTTTSLRTGQNKDKDKKEEEYDEMVWEGKLDEIAEAIQQNTPFDLERLWNFFDTNQSGVIDSRKTLSKLVFSLFCVFVK
ncbi:hypothetical protein RFI_30102, partial [Reticulomyxa filosa]